ncbi:MAG: signal peptidase II [Chitinispirillaceae bacterium]|nr:signal peptidase II [Chitinispirillaceae bacterium]
MPQKVVKYLLIILVLFAGIATDQLSKRWAATNLKNQPTNVFVKNLIDLGYTENHGMVFGINNRSDNTVQKNALLIIRILLGIGLTIYIGMNISKPVFFHLPFLLILSGAIGNVIDSLRYGHVIDFIHLHLGKLLDWPFLFNLADAYVVFGMGILIIQSYLTGQAKQPAPPFAPDGSTEQH